MYLMEATVTLCVRDPRYLMRAGKSGKSRPSGLCVVLLTVHFLAKCVNRVTRIYFSPQCVLRMYSRIH